MSGRFLARWAIRRRQDLEERLDYMVVSAIGGNERVVAELPQDVGDPITPFGASWSSTWLPDGKSIVLDGLRLLSLETGVVRDLTDRQGRRVVGWFPAVAPDGQTLASRGRQVKQPRAYLLDSRAAANFGATCELSR